MREGRALLLLAVASLLAPSGCSSCDRDEPAPPRAPAAPARLTAHSGALENGLRVDLLTGPCGDRAAVAMQLDVGTDSDPSGRSGMARLVERVLAAAMASEGEWTVTTGRAHTLVSIALAPARVPAALDALASRMRALEVTQAELDRARTALLDEVASRRGGDPMRTATSIAEESVHPSGGPGWRGGSAEEIESLTPADVTAFWRAHYQAGNARLVVVGAADAAQLRTRVDATFGPLPRGEAPSAREHAGSTVTGTLVMGDAPSALAIAVPAPSPAEAEHAAFLVLAARLVAEPRAWEARYDPLLEPETLLVTYALTPAEPAEPAAARVRGELSTLVGQPLAPGEIAAAQARFARWLGVGETDPEVCAEDPRALAVARARRAELDLPRELAPSEDDLREAAARFGPRRSTAVLAGGSIR